MSTYRYPIVLAHGIARFDILREILIEKTGIKDDVSDNLHYFKGIKIHLETNGFEVHHTSVDFAGSVELRASQLSNQINEILNKNSAGKVHIIAHSMGGLDARRMIVDIDGMAEKIASLTTIGTPHLGTSFADIGITFGGRLIIDSLNSFLDIKGFDDLTTESCAAFNRRTEMQEADNDVIYQTYSSSQERDHVFLPLQPSWFIINKREGRNDGLVSVKSQCWKNQLIGTNGQKKKVKQLQFPFPADHLNQIGWWDMQEDDSVTPVEYEGKIKDIYLQIARQVVAA